LAGLSQGLASGSLRTAFASSAGCCLPHLAALLQAAPDQEMVRVLLDSWLGQMERLQKELVIYERETTSRTREYGSVADAPMRAMVCWAGMRGMVSGSGEEKPGALLCSGTD